MTNAEEHLREIAQRYIDGSSLATGELSKLAHGVVVLLVTIETLRGSRCAVAQGVDGLGGCGVCPSCARDARVRAETATLRAERLTRELAEARGGDTGASQAHYARALAERDAARQERDAMKAMMPKPPYDADTLERAARGTYADRTVRGMARALLRLSPPSAPAQARALDAERTQLEVDDD